MVLPPPRLLIIILMSLCGVRNSLLTLKMARSHWLVGGNGELLLLGYLIIADRHSHCQRY